MNLEKEPRFYQEYDLGNINKSLLINNSDLTYGLAKWNREFGGHKLAQDLDVLKLGDGKVANWLAFCSDVNGWGRTKASQKLEILKLCDGEVVRWLAERSVSNGWGETPAAENEYVRGLRGGIIGELIDGKYRKKDFNNFRGTFC